MTDPIHIDAVRCQRLVAEATSTVRRFQRRADQHDRHLPFLRDLVTTIWKAFRLLLSASLKARRLPKAERERVDSIINRAAASWEHSA